MNDPELINFFHFGACTGKKIHLFISETFMSVYLTGKSYIYDLVDQNKTRVIYI